MRYIQTRDEFEEKFLTDAAKRKLYDSLVYQITLRTIHELNEADVVEAIDSIVFNGWVKSVDLGTGQEITPCIVSIQANREEFLAINLYNVDPKVCFKTLKGIGSTQLHSLTPIAPLLKIDREDFYDLLADHIRITQGVLKTLSKRLRGLLGRVNLDFEQTS